MPRWIRVSAVMMMMVAFVGCGSPSPSAQNTGTAIEYATPQAALSALRANPRVEIRENQGWVTATDNASSTVWMFPPSTHPAAPAAVKRTLVEQDGKIVVFMSMLCRGPRADCDRLVAEMQQLTERMRDAMQRTLRPRP